MISLETARRLKEAGLLWRAGNHDFFAVPDRGMDDHVFVITDIMSHLELVQGWPAVAFHGTAEWALDYILTGEVIWLPTESQLREVIVELAEESQVKSLCLERIPGGYRCTIGSGNNLRTREAGTAEESYALILLHLLHRQGDPTTL